MSSLIKHTRGVGLEAQMNRNITEQMLGQTTPESIVQRKVFVLYKDSTDL